MTIIWRCTVGHRDVARDSLSPGCDSPMRDAVESAFLAIAGVDPEFTFSGWGFQRLTESELAVVEGRVPDHTKEEWDEASEIVDEITARANLDLSDFTVDREVVDEARSALVDLIAYVRRHREGAI